MYRKKQAVTPFTFDFKGHILVISWLHCKPNTPSSQSKKSKFFHYFYYTFFEPGNRNLENDVESYGMIHLFYHLLSNY
ncbi:hypothetical protein WV34_18710 [Bacillus amyloliquefaciens]|nr:hypothetical protein WV34_18710 [Bacillus amyloliquefaciens]